MSVERPKSNWFLKTVLSIVAFCIVAFVIDLSIASWGERIILARNADFEQQLQSANLDFNGPSTQGCNQRYVLKIYLYQTCFLKGNRPRIGLDGNLLNIRKGVPLDNNERYFIYILQRPQPWLFSRGDGTEYYFQATGMGQSLMIVWSDFSYEKTIGKTF